MLPRSLGRTFVLLTLASLLLVAGQLAWAQSPPTTKYLTDLGSVGTATPPASWTIFRYDGSELLISDYGLSWYAADGTPVQVDFARELPGGEICTTLAPSGRLYMANAFAVESCRPGRR